MTCNYSLRKTYLGRILSTQRLQKTYSQKRRGQERTKRKTNIKNMSNEDKKTQEPDFSHFMEASSSQENQAKASVTQSNDLLSGKNRSQCSVPNPLELQGMHRHQLLR